MIRTQLYEDLKGAMKNKEAVKLETLRFLWSEIKNVEIDAKHELSDEEVLQVLKREVKKRKEAIEQFEKAGRNDLAQAETEKLAVVEVYVPQMMSREEIEAVVAMVISEGKNDFGLVMKETMSRTKGQAEGKLVAEVVKAKLS